MGFIKGVMVGGIVTTGIVMIYADNMGMINRKKMMKQGRKMAKRMGII